MNLVASACLLVMVLAFLRPDAYLQWILFTTIAGALIQLEQSVSALATRSISRGAAAAGPDALDRALRGVRAMYHRFASIGCGLMLAMGAAYLSFAANGRFSSTWLFEWGVFCAGYFVYYFLAHAACSLIAFERPDIHAICGMTTRVLNVMLAGLLLAIGLGTAGLSLGVFLSFVVGAFLYKGSAARLLARIEPQQEVAIGLDQRAHTAPDTVPVKQLGAHALYLLGSYGLYRCGLMVDAGTSANSALQASYGLALQLLTLIALLSAVPLAMRVAPLVRHAHAGHLKEAVDELGRLALYVNAVFLSAAAALLLGAHLLPYISGANGVRLPPTHDLALLTMGYWVELNVLILVNALLAVQRFDFVQRYFASLAIAFLLFLVARLGGTPFYISSVLIPLAVQATVALPLIFAQVADAYAMTPSHYMASMWRQLRRFLPNEGWGS